MCSPGPGPAFRQRVNQAGRTQVRGDVVQAPLRGPGAHQSEPRSPGIGL